MNHYSDPTANQAVGAVNREWVKMVRLAIRIRQSGDYAYEERESWRFTGIYKRLLTDDIELLRQIVAN